MQAVSSRFLAALRVSHHVVVRALIYRPGNPTPLEAKVIGGQVRADRDARVRRQGSLNVAFSLVDDAETVRTLPFGGYVALERGIVYADATEELAPVGLLRIDAASWTGEEGQATFSLSDRMAQVQDEPFTTPWAPAGLKPSDAVRAAVEQVFGTTIDYTIETDPASEPVLADVVYDQDRAQAVGDLASSVSAEAYFDAAGDFVLAPRPDLDLLEPVWAVDAGEGGALEGVLENLDRTTVRNGVAVRGLGTADAPPVFALAVDDDPGSPTEWGGPFGKVATISSSSAVMTQAQADASARSQLNLRLGAARTLTLRALPNPAVEPGDAIEVHYSDGRTEKQMINAVELPLDVTGSLTLVTTSQWRPPGVEPHRRIRVYTGDAAWRELEEAVVR